MWRDSGLRTQALGLQLCRFPVSVSQLLAIHGLEPGRRRRDEIAPTGKRFETFFTTIAKWKNGQIVEEYGDVRSARHHEASRAVAGLGSHKETCVITIAGVSAAKPRGH